MTKKSPLIILGPGRCATSFTTRFLVERLGYFAGWRYIRRTLTSGDNPHARGGPTYEDADFGEVLVSRSRLEITWDQTRLYFQSFVQERESQHPWCVKNPAFCELLPLVHQFCPSAFFVRLHRPLPEIIESFCKSHPNRSREQHAEIVTARDYILNEHVDETRTLHLDITDWRNESAERKLIDFCERGEVA